MLNAALTPAYQEVSVGGWLSRYVECGPTRALLTGAVGDDPDVEAGAPDAASTC